MGLLGCVVTRQTKSTLNLLSWSQSCERDYLSNWRRFCSSNGCARSARAFPGALLSSKDEERRGLHLSVRSLAGVAAEECSLVSRGGVGKVGRSRRGSALPRAESVGSLPQVAHRTDRRIGRRKSNRSRRDELADGESTPD